jgi:hypothetical protein
MSDNNLSGSRMRLAAAERERLARSACRRARACEDDRRFPPQWLREDFLKTVKRKAKSAAPVWRQFGLDRRLSLAYGTSREGQLLHHPDR